MLYRYIVSYDITEPRRLKQVYKTLRGFGDHLQYSVFRCDLSRRELAELVAAVDALIHHDNDQVLIVDLGPASGRAARCVRALGKRYSNPERHAIVV